VTAIVVGALLSGAFVGTAGATGNTKSTYCDEARRWAVHELDSIDESDAVVVERYWGEYLGFVERSQASAPKPLRDAWAVYVTRTAAFTAVLVKYAYDIELLFETGTDADKALFVDDPPADYQAAITTIFGYESEVCGSMQPLAADISFAGETPGAYCDLVLADIETSAEIFAAGGNPADVEAYVLDRIARGADAQLLAAAPDVIRDDVQAEVAWWAQRQYPVLARFGYDFRKLLLEGSKQDREDLQLTDKKIRDHFARAVAYEEQVCGA
jgi:hypothetical protein